MASRRSIVILFSVAVLLGLLGGPVVAADPAEGTLVAPPEGSDQIDWTGTVPPGTGGQAACGDELNADAFSLTLELPEEDLDFYSTHTGTLTVEILWEPTSDDPSTSDLALFVVHEGSGSQRLSNQGTPKESVSIVDPASGVYTIYACNQVNTAEQPYLGHASVTTVALGEGPQNPPSTPGDQRWSPITIADPQRDVAEPSLRIDPKGNEYTCGPFGASRAADYAQKSEDGGDTFRNLGLPPEGRIAPGGGGDCELSWGPVPNELGEHTLAYTGLEALINFSTATSRDAGLSWLGTDISESPVVVDRQWMDGASTDIVYLTYRQVPLGSFVQRSDNGGLVYDPGTLAIPEIYVSGNLLVDRFTETNEGTAEDPHTLYVAHTYSQGVRIARSLNNETGPWEIMQVISACPDATDPATTLCTMGEPSSFFPTVAQDNAGTLYAAWVERGSYNAYYSYCTPEGEFDCLYPASGAPEDVPAEQVGQLWSPKVQVNRDGVMSTVMPWMTAGDAGRIAISFYGSTVNGNPEVGTFRGPWDVYVNTILDADNVDPEDPNATAVNQTAVTTHPIHWDSICLSGIACTTGGDRTLLDFFQVDHDPQGRLRVAYNESNKRYGEAAGPMAIVTYSKQTGGADLIGDPEPPDPRPVVSDFRADPAEDALFPFSIFPAPPVTPPGFRENHPGMDILEVTAAEGDAEGEPGVTFTMSIADLSAAAREEAQVGTTSTNLLYVVRFFSGFTPHAAVASMSPTGTFTFGYSDFTTSPDGKLEIYPQTEAIPGSIDEETGVITMTVPYSLIEHVTPNEADPAAEPTIRPVETGDRIYEITGYTFGNPLGTAGAQYFLNTVDVSPPFDHILTAAGPNPTDPPSPPPGPGETGEPSGPPGGGASPTPRNRIPNTSDGPIAVVPATLALAAIIVTSVLTFALARGVHRRRTVE